MKPTISLLRFLKTDGTPADYFKTMRESPIAPAPVWPSYEENYVNITLNDGVTNLKMLVLTPKHRQNSEPLGVLFEIHGGGFVMNDERFLFIYKDFFDPVESEFVVFSPAYRLAPDYPFPHAPEDCYSALKWVRQNARNYGGDPDRIIVSGTSAGGNLAAVISIIARDDPEFNPKPLMQILHVPSVDFHGQTRSAAEFTDTPIWGTCLSLHTRRAYIPNPQDWKNPRASPIYAESHKNLPPGVLIINNYDPARDGGLAYYEKLKSAGVPVEICRFDSYHAGDVVAWEIFGGYKKEFAECRAKLKQFRKSYAS